MSPDKWRPGILSVVTLIGLLFNLTRPAVATRPVSSLQRDVMLSTVLNASTDKTDGVAFAPGASPNEGPAIAPPAAPPQSPPAQSGSPHAGPIVSPPVVPGFFKGDLRNLPPLQPYSGEIRELPLRLLPGAQAIGTSPKGASRQPGGELRQPGPGPAVFPPLAGNMPAPSQNWEGLGNGDGVLPPDTVGDVGLTYYIQQVNIDDVGIFEKTTGTLVAAFDLASLWDDGTLCQTAGGGDPITLYDPLADRWLISQFALVSTGSGPFFQCIAISATSGDPISGGWYTYSFEVTNDGVGLPGEAFFNDYPKFGVWPDAYYMSANQFGTRGSFIGGAWAFDRAAMLGGAPAGKQYFAANFEGGLLPSDLDGLTPPPAGRPNYFVNMVEGANTLRVYEFHVDWINPANSTLTGPLNLTTAPYDTDICPNFREQCIHQPDGAPQLEAIADRLMHRLAYRNFGSHGTLLVNHTVDANGAGQAGIRWYELRDSGAGWTIHQQGTYAGDAPNGEHRWMGSIAMDRNGNIALGYSVSGLSTYPSIRYTGRLASDPADTLPQGEASIIGGGGSQTHPAARWGDYSAMSVDPRDDCTFWYTQEYMASTSSANWQTRIAAFKFPSCTAGPTGAIEGTVTDAGTSGPLAGAQIAADFFNTLSDDSGFYRFSQVPTGNYTVTASAYGYAPATVTNVDVLSGATTIQDFALTPVPLVIIDGTVTDANTGWPLYAKIIITALGGFNQTIYTNPETGNYSIALAEGSAHAFNVSSIIPGYQSETRLVIPPSGGGAENFALDVDAVACEAPGYQLSTSALLFSDDFESGYGNWTMTGLWNPENEADACGALVAPFPSSSNDAYFGLDGGTCTFATADIAAGSLTLAAPLALPVVGRTDLSFWSFEETECGGNCFWDNRFIEISDDSGASWALLGEGEAEGAWYQKSLNISPYEGSDILLRFRFDSVDSSFNDFFGWMVDDVAIAASSCLPQSGGLVIGHVYDNNTLLALNGANVGNDSGQATITMATPGDPNLDDGFYALFSPAGPHIFTATLTNYSPDVRTPTVVQSDTIRQDFFLDAGQLSHNPDDLAATVMLGSSATRPLTLTNSGQAAAMFELLELDKGRTVLGPIEKPQYVVKPFKQNQVTAEGLSFPPPPAALPYAAGDIIQTWPTGLVYGWGLGYNTAETDMWIGNLAAGGGDDLNYRFLPDGTNTGDTIDTSPWVGIFAADMTFNPNTGMLWQVNVGGDDCIHELDPVSMTATGNSICPAFLSDQRGLAYDPTTDVYFAGSWNDGLIYRFAPDGTILEQISVNLSTAGLAYNPDTQHLFVMVNDIPNPVYVLDAADNFALLGQFNVAGFADFGGAGFEMDCDGNLWAVDQQTQTVYQFESGETTATLCNFDVPWLSEAPISGTLASLASLPITIGFDASVPAVDQPGQYFAQLKINEDTPYARPTIPVTMTVMSPPTWGKLDGTVTSLGRCDANPAPLKEAEVFLQSGAGMTWTLTTDISGAYKIWLDEANSPLTVTVSHPDHLTEILSGINVTAQITATQDFDLRQVVPCLGVDPAALNVTVGLGLSRTLPLTLANAGAGGANFELLELPGGYTPTLAPLMMPPGSVPEVSASSAWGELPALETRRFFEPQPRAVGSLPIIISDPAGDANIIDITDVEALSIALDMTMRIHFGSGAGPTGAVGYIHLDTDQNPATGLPPADLFGLPTQDIGFDYYLSLFNLPTSVDIFNANNIYIASVTPIYTPDAVEFTIPLSALGNDDGRIDVTMVLGDLFGPTDWAPDIGHGSIAFGDVPWLSEAPTTGALAADTGRQLIDITFDASVVTQTGKYTATLLVNGNNPVNDSIVIPVTMIVSPYGLALQPVVDSRLGDPGMTVTYTLRVRNAGLLADTFDLALDGQAWPTTAPATTGVLAPGEQADIAVTVAIPVSALAYAQDEATITLTSQGESAVSAVARLTTIANALYRVNVTPPTDTRSGNAGTLVTYILNLANAGNITDTFVITASDHNWPTTIPLERALDSVAITVGPLAAGASEALKLNVFIPPTATEGEQDTVTIHVSSETLPHISSSAVLTTTMKPGGPFFIYMPVILK